MLGGFHSEVALSVWWARLDSNRYGVRRQGDSHTKGILSPVCETISIERDILVKNPPEFLLKHHVQREGMHIRKSSVDFFVEIGKAADREQYIDIFVKRPLFYSGNVNFVKFLFGHRFCNRIPYLYKDTLPSIHLRVVK